MIYLAVAKDPRLLANLPEDDPYLYEELEPEFLGPKPPKFRVSIFFLESILKETVMFMNISKWIDGIDLLGIFLNVKYQHGK